MNIYFGGAVRGGSHDRLATWIAQLSRFGRVVTEHMARPDPPSRTAREIHDLDQQLLAIADVVIADCTVPSTGTGYMLARACARKLPVLALVQAGTTPSAMIAGSPQIVTKTYTGDDFMPAVTQFFVEQRLRTDRPRVFLSGPPGSGKGTLAARLAADTGAIHISTGELLRALPDAHPHAAQIRADMAAGRLVSATLMRDIVIEKLRSPECDVFGYILDGYPPSREDLANLAGIVPDVVIMLDVSDATAIARQIQRASRSTDTADKARDRLRVFHAAGIADAWYPDSLVAHIDGERSPDAVLASAHAILAGRSTTQSYYVLAGTPRSTRLHFHIDAPTHDQVHALAKAITIRHRAAQGQLKIYPIDGLALGPQHAQLAIYPQLPNFHPITTTGEAFVTGRLGDGDHALMQAVLETVRDQHQGPGHMVELEEYLGEWTLRTDGTTVVDNIYPALGGDHAYPDFTAHRAEHIPRWELHHGFDIAKTSATPPYNLDEIVALSASLGLANGGWFLFAKPDHWAYRSNEFANGDQDTVMARLVAQAHALSTALSVDIGYGLEIVHGIWLFD